GRMLGVPGARRIGNNRQWTRPETVKTPQAMPVLALPTEPLAGVLARLRAIGVVPQLATALEGSQPALTLALRRFVVADVPAYSASGNPQILPDLERHAEEQIREVARLLGGGEVGDL